MLRSQRDTQELQQEAYEVVPIHEPNTTWVSHLKDQPYHPTSAQRPPLPSTRPLLLPCRCWCRCKNCMPSRCSWRSCWPSTLRQEPVAKAKASQKHSWRLLNWNLELQLHESGKQWPVELSFLSQLNMLKCPAMKDAAFASRYYTCANPLKSSRKSPGQVKRKWRRCRLYHWQQHKRKLSQNSSKWICHSQRLFQRIHRPNTSCDSRVSTTIHVPLPAPRGAPFAEPQACAPSLLMPMLCKLMFVRVVLIFNASARACGQKRWQAGRLAMQSTKTLATQVELLIMSQWVPVPTRNSNIKVRWG